MQSAHRDDAAPALAKVNVGYTKTRLRTAALQSAIFNSANFSSIATDANGVIQIFNVGAERMLGFAAADVVNKITPADISDPAELILRAQSLSAELKADIAPGFEALVFKARRGIEDIYELTYIRKDKSRFPAMVSVTALRNKQDAVIGYLLIGTDNTARKQVEDERTRLEQILQLKNVELESASRMKSEFLANMSHELRTPLNAIIGFSEVLRDGLTGPMTDQQRGFIGDIYDSGNHLLSLINDILDLSKIEAGKMLLELDMVAMPVLLANSLSIIREKAMTRQIHVSMDPADDVLPMQVDARKVKQIVYNLLSNAVKFTAEGGQVTLRIKRVARADVGRGTGAWPSRSLVLAESDFAEFLQISVTDSGIGISPAGLERLFKPFSQIDGGLGRKFEGTGLGLAMVKLLAELHGGAVAVESAEGKGSCFTVWLPVRALERPPRVSGGGAGTPGSVSAIGNARTALVIENDVKAAGLLRLQLEAEGFTVLHAASAEAALLMVAEQPLALITIDLLLPQMDGWALLMHLKQRPDLQHIPVVVMSIVAERERGFDLGAAAVLQKPVSRTQLSAALGEIGLITRASPVPG